MSNRIYLDYNATTPMSPEVLDFYKDQLSLYANASSLHEDGRRAKKEIEIARKNVADLVNVLPEEIIFTSASSPMANPILVPRLYHLFSRICSNALL